MASNPSPLHKANKIFRSDNKRLSSNGNIAAIDFGTTFCSLAYCMVGVDETKLLMFDGDGSHPRVPNALLLHKNSDTGVCKVVEFGYRAHSSYTRIRANDRINYIYFARIKPLLWKDEVKTVICSYNYVHCVVIYLCTEM